MRLWVCFLLFSAGCFAQAGRTELFGTIEDPQQLPIPGAHVEAVEQSTGARFAAAAGERGDYHLLGLPPGRYTLAVEQPGFRGYRQESIVLRAAAETRIDVELQVGPSSQAIEVTGSAPLLETSSGEVAYHVEDAKLAALPLDGRNFVPLVALAPGVALPGGGSLLPRINGSRPRTNEYLYDGISVLQPEPGQVAWYPIPDAIEEFKLNLNAYSPEYGRSNGGTVMVIGKAGGNRLHGTVFEFLRNEALNARNYFAQPGPSPEFRRNQYGFTLGGPIQKNRTFFFVDWQGTRQRTGIPRISTVPTAAQRAGVFAATIVDPASSPRQAFPANTIPQERFDPVARQVLARYPAPNLGGAANNYIRSGVEPEDQDQFDLRVDRHIGARHRLFARYSFWRDDDTPVAPLEDGSGALTSGVVGHAVTRADGVAAAHEWALSASTLNQARFGYTRRRLRQSPLAMGVIPIPGIPQNAFDSAMPIFAVAGYQQIGPTSAASSDFATSVTEYLDTLSMVRGRHTLKVGVDVRREALDVLNPPNPTGAFSFTAAGTGQSVASLLLGQVNAFSIDLQQAAIRERARFAEFFVGDDWRVSDRLTLNLGTRYTLNFPSTIVNGRGGVFNLATQRLDYPRTARELECCDFGPRAGLAYRAGGAWVLRAGYGMVWFEQSGITTPFTAPQFPLIQTVGQQSPDNLSPAFVLSGGPSVAAAPAGPYAGLGQGVFGVDRNNGSGYSQQWNATVQRTVGRNVSLEAAYLGSKNTRLGIPDWNLNQLPAQDLAIGAALAARVANPYYGAIPASSSLGGPTLAAQQLLRPFPEYTTVALFRDNVGNSTYHALALKLEKRFSGGLTVTAAYTFSRLIDDASSVFSQTIFTGPVLNNTGAADANNRHLEKDLSSGDIPQVFAAGWVYDIPRIWKVGGWQVAGMVRVQSGDRVAVSQATNTNSNLGFAVQRPNLVGDPNGYGWRSPARWFNTAAFAAAAQYTLGTSSRNPVRGPGLQQADLMLGKHFRVNDQSSVELRLEAFNVSNTPPLADPSGSFGAAAFGSITKAGNPRVFEAAVKLHF